MVEEAEEAEVGEAEAVGDGDLKVCIFAHTLGT